MKKLLRIFFFTFLILLTTICESSNKNKKTLFVDYFGLTIYNVDENADTIFEREDDLISYASDKKFTILILKSIDAITYGNGSLLFLKDDTISCGMDSIGSSKDRKFLRLPNFLKKCRTAGIEHIAAADSPFRYTRSGSIYTYHDNRFFDNIIIFNEFYSSNNNTLSYFDILYGEEDYWSTENPTTDPVVN